ncbi:hypothetical protein MMC28_010741 [Mycoblastus sanguinarius]|nr:hypothetical protein [Mycoblastus sanguinarius]
MAQSSSNLPTSDAPSAFLELLPAKAYVPPQANAETGDPFMKSRAEDQAMPTEDNIKAATKKRRSSSTSTASSVASNNDRDKWGFLPLAELEE